MWKRSATPGLRRAFAGSGIRVGCFDPTTFLLFEKILGLCRYKNSILMAYAYLHICVYIKLCVYIYIYAWLWLYMYAWVPYYVFVVQFLKQAFSTYSRFGRVPGFPFTVPFSIWVGGSGSAQRKCPWEWKPELKSKRNGSPDTER